MPSESEIQLEADSVSNDFLADKKNLTDENDLLTKNLRFTKQQSYFQRENTNTNMNINIRIRTLSYGEFIFLDVKDKEEECRVCSVLDSLKMFNSRDSRQNVVNMRRSCF